MKEVILKRGREKAVLRRHPWIFSGAVDEVHGEPAPGDTVRVLDARGRFLAWGAYSPESQIRIRIWSWKPDEQIDADFLRRRLQSALALRSQFFPSKETNAVRLVHGESDGLPGLVVDRYGDTVVVQLLSAGPERWRETLVDLLVELARPMRVFERSDADVRELEGLPQRVGSLYGGIPARLEVREGRLKFWVDLHQGHKTGFYLDQRTNRALVSGLSEGLQILDCFSYTGGFTAAALSGGARQVTAVDASAEALDLARENIRLNGFNPEAVEWITGDAFQVLRQFRDAGRSFDLVVLDPPKFAPTSAQVQRAARGYKDINLLGFKLLRPGGTLVTFSCSGGVSEELFQKILADAALDAEVDARIVKRLHQDRDHPVALNFPEGAYLKGFVIRV